MMFGDSKPEPVKPLFAEKFEPKTSLFSAMPASMPEPKPLLGLDKDPGKPAKNLFPQQPSES